MRLLYNLAGLSGIALIITSTILFITELLVLFELISQELYILLNVILLVITSIFGIVFALGFWRLGKTFKLPLLSISSMLSIIFAVITTIGWILIFTIEELNNDLVIISYSVILFLVTGTLSIVFGIAILGLKEQFKGIASALGWLSIITGMSFLTVILSFVGLFLTLPMAIISIIMMFQAPTKIG